VPEAQLFVPGSPALAMPDNIALQPHRANWIIHEDAETVTDLQGPTTTTWWDCLPDGTDPTSRATAASASPPSTT
jgi:hypothetical protein